MVAMGPTCLLRAPVSGLSYGQALHGPDSCKYLGRASFCRESTLARSRSNSAGALDGFWPTQNHRGAGAGPRELILLI
jgi:hypothetical protein